MEVGASVFVKGVGCGLVALDNEDGTWNVEFEDGREGDFYEKDLQKQEDRVAQCPAGVRLGGLGPCPEGWTRFVCFSDTHGMHDMIPAKHMPPADVLLHAGDFTNTGELEQIKSFNDWLERYPAKEKVVIAGNHDVTLHEEYYRSRGAARFHPVPYDCSKARGLLSACSYLEDEALEIRGYELYGTPWQPEFCDWAFNLPTEELRKRWQAIPETTDLLLVHGPPLNHGDRTSRDTRVGCPELLSAVQRRRIAAVVSGHLHESYGTSTDGATLYVNASTCTSDMRCSRPPIIFDLPLVQELREATKRAALERA